MNFNAEFYKFSFYKKEFFTICLFINFLPVIGSNKKFFLTSILNNINQFLVILLTENIFILVILFTWWNLEFWFVLCKSFCMCLNIMWMVVIQYNCVFYVNASYSVGVFNVNASHFVCVFYVNPSHSVCECHAENIIATYVPIFVNADNFVNVLWRKNYCNLSTHICKCWSFCECQGGKIITTWPPIYVMKASL